MSRVLAVVSLIEVESALSPRRILAQDASPAPTQTGTLAVFLDCQGGCDTQFIRTEIAYVNWVRDRTVADVHVLITSQDAVVGLYARVHRTARHDGSG
jgi:hypothetical protein